MSILTPETCKEVWLTCESIEDEKFWPELASKLEAAVIKRLAAGVSVEPVAYMNHYTVPVNIGVPGDAVYEKHSTPSLTQKTGSDPLYTATAIAAARVQMEKAIKDAYMEGFFSMATYNDTQVNDENEEWEKSNAKCALLGKEAT